jgi:hypothetical protein
MAEKRMTCFRCPTYDRVERRCRVGKSNPKKKHESLTIAEILGPRALCVHNPFREPLLLRMHFPDRRFLWDTRALPAASGTLEVTIIEDFDALESMDDSVPGPSSAPERNENG